MIDKISSVMMKICRLYCALLFVTLSAHGQSPVIKNYTMDDGLPSNTIYNVFFDSKGYMWVGTDKGIARYNGRSFKIFTTYDGLPDNEVFGFTEDSEKRLWISNFKGVLCYYKDNIFHTDKNTPWLKLPPFVKPAFFSSFWLEKDGSLYSGNTDGDFLIAIKNNTVKTISTHKIKLMVIDSCGPMFVEKINNQYLHLYYFYESFIVDTSSNIIKRIPYKDKQRYQGVLGRTPNLFITTNGLYHKSDYKEYPLNSIKLGRYEGVTAYIQDSAHYFITTSAGLLYNRDKMLFEGIHLTSIDHDNLGNIWVSSIDKGVFCINRNFDKIYNYSVKSKIVTAANADSLTYFLTESGDLYKFKSRSMKLLYSLKESEKHVLDKPYWNKNNTTVTKNGDVFFINTFEVPHGGQISLKRRDSDFLETASISYLEALCFPTKRISNSNGIFYVSIRGGVWIVNNTDLQKGGYKVSNHVADLYERIFYGVVHEKDSTFWISKANNMFSLKNGIITQQKKLTNHTFRQFNFYKDYLVGSTDDNKLFIYDTQSGYLDSLPASNSIWSDIYQINDHTAIIGTNGYYRMLSLFPDKNGKPDYHLQTIENPFIPMKADYIFGDSSMTYFQKNGEISGFPNSMLSEASMPPKPIFVAVKTEKAVFSPQPVVNISYNEAQTIRIQIDAISYTNKTPTTEYSISENDVDHWNATISEEINLNNINYGKYVIKLRSKTVSSKYSAPAIITLNIDKPFWVRWWFILLCSAFFLAVLFLVFKMLTSRQLKKKQKEFDAESRFQQSEYKALNALMNPHFVFNSLNNIQSLINKKSTETANQYLVIFSKLIRQNMINISKGFVSLFKELQLVENYLNLEKLRFKQLVNFTVEIDEDVDTEEIMIPPLLIQPLVENAIVHGLLPMQSEKSTLRIKVYEQGDVLHIEVIDNGIGLSQSLKNKGINDHESYGLTNFNRRIEHIRKIQKKEINFTLQEIFDDFGNSKGTIASIQVTL